MYNGYFTYELDRAFKKFNRTAWELIFHPYGWHTSAQQTYYDFGCMYMMGGEL